MMHFTPMVGTNTWPLHLKWKLSPDRLKQLPVQVPHLNPLQIIMN